MSLKQSVKALVRRAARPFMTSARWRVENLIDENVSRQVMPRIDMAEATDASLRRSVTDIEGAVEQVRDELAALREEVRVLRHQYGTMEGYGTVLLNTISSHNAAARDHERRLAALEAQTPGHAGGTGARVEPMVLNPDKLARLDGELRVHFGSEPLAAGDYVNVAEAPAPDIDVVADLADLPFASGQLAEIHCGHSFERFRAEQLERLLLPYWVDLLRDGGRFVTVVADAETMIAEHAAGRLPFDDLRRGFYGADSDSAGDRRSMFSTQSLHALLERVGLVDVKIRQTVRHDGGSYWLEAEATRPVVEGR